MALATSGPSVADFFQRYLRHTKGRGAGTAFVMEPWQAQFVNEFYRVDARGQRIYKLGVLGIPRGNGKSPMAAGFGLREMMARTDSPDVFCIAGSKEQAQIVHGFAREFVEAGPLRRYGVKPGKHAITYARTNGSMKVLAAGGGLTHGLSVSAAIADEIHVFTSQPQVETWNAMFTALHKRDESFALAITTAGFDKETLLGRIYDRSLNLPGVDRNGGCLRIRRDLKNGVLFWWYGVPEDLEHRWDDPTLWRAANPASWLRMEELQKLLNAPSADELDFKRLHLNMFTASRESWLPPGVWAGLVDELPDPPKGTKVYIGVDVGWSHDSTAVVYAWRLSDGRIAVKSRVWTTLPDQQGEFVEGGTMKLELVEDHILRLKARYRIRECAYDPNYFGRSAELLERKGVKMVAMAPQAGPAQEAWQTFFQKACEGQVAHDGDKVLEAHVNSAGLVMTNSGPRVRKQKSTGRIDALAAMVMAVARCDLNTRPSRLKPNVFWLDPNE